MIGLRDTRNKPLIVFNAVDVIAAADLLSYTLTQFSPTVKQTINDSVIAGIQVMNIGLLDATAFEKISTNATVNAEVLTIDLFDVTVTTQVLELPNIVPDADVSNAGGWSPTPLWSRINDPGDDTDWISSTNDNGTTCTISLTSPIVATGGTIHITRKKGTGSSNPTFLWELILNGSVIQSNSVSITSSTFIDTTTPLDANLVPGGDYQIRFTRSGGGSPSARASVDVGAFWIDPT